MAETSKQVSPSIWSINIDHENQLVASWHSCFGYFTIFAIYINLKYNANLCSRRQRCFSELIKCTEMEYIFQAYFKCMVLIC